MAGSISPARARVMRMLDIAAFSNLPGRQGEAVPYSSTKISIDVHLAFAAPDLRKASAVSFHDSRRAQRARGRACRL